jgi:hypothetical protein
MNNGDYLNNTLKGRVDRIIGTTASEADTKTRQLVKQHTGTECFFIAMVVENQWEHCRTAFVKAKGDILELYLNAISHDPNIFNSITVETLKALSATLTDLENEAKHLKEAEDRLYYAWRTRYDSERLKFEKKKHKKEVLEAKRKNKQKLQKAKMEDSLEIQKVKKEKKLEKFARIDETHQYSATPS